jgi:hypothetical protein
VHDENTRVPFLTACGEPDNPRAASKRRKNAQKSTVKPTGENLTARLDFGGLIEGISGVRSNAIKLGGNLREITI